ncbi:MAG: DNA polymerase III subunit delta [Chloroflexi bacterium]|nr:DNA polymerase III subunit delta [Chloroflexota bacterium]
MITLIHGPAELLRAEALAQIRGQVADDPSLADLNTAQLNGRQVTVAELENACDALPFLAERRLVIVEGLVRRLAAPVRSRKTAPEAGEGEDDEASEELAPELTKAQGKALLAYLDHVPPTTELVLVEEDTIGGGTVLRRLMELQGEGKAKVILCAKPRRNELPDWIRARARLRKVKLDPSAVADLADFVGDELRQLDQELLKLADYAGDGRAITRADVRRLVPATRAASVFELADALGMGDAPTAARLMQHALDVDGEPALRLLAMIARQYRLLLQAKALQAQGARPADIGRTLEVAEWTVPKLLTQAGRHTFAALERAMGRILAADEAIKTGKMGDREAMDVLLAELTQGA